MTFGALIEQTVSRLRDEGIQDTAGFRSSANKFLKRAGLSPQSECADAHLSLENVQRLRAEGEAAGWLSAAGSSAWASRVKQLVATWELLKVRASGASFWVVLEEDIKTTKETRWTYAQQIPASVEITYDDITRWLRLRQLPSERFREPIERLDRFRGLGGRLVATLTGLRLQVVAKRQVFTEADRSNILAGQASLHTTMRFFAKESKKGISALVRETGIASLFRHWLHQVSPDADRPEILRAEDLPAVEKWDEFSNAGGRVVAAFQRELAKQGGPRKKERFGFPYLDWPAPLKAEYKRLCDYKTTNPEGLERSERGRWVTYTLPDGTLRVPSEPGMRSSCELIFGYALRAGLVLKPENLRLAHITVVEIISGALIERMRRNKRDRLNEADTKVIDAIYTLTWGGSEEDGSGCGYFANDEVGRDFWGDPYFAARLPTEWLPVAVGGYRIARAPIAIPRGNVAGRWQAYLWQSNRKLRKFELSQEFAKSDFAESIRDILNNPDFDIGAWIKAGFEKLISTVPARSSAPLAWARHVRLCVLFLLNCTRGFRKSTHYRLEVTHVVWNALALEYQYQIPEDLTKGRGKGGSKGGVQAAVDDVLGEFDKKPKGFASLPGSATALLDVFLKEARPLLGIKSNSFYGWHKDLAVYNNFRRVCRLAFGRNVPPHAMRYLIATWCKRAGIPVDRAASILLHLPKATQTIYDKTTAVDRGREANATVKQLFGKSAA